MRERGDRGMTKPSNTSGMRALSLLYLACAALAVYFWQGLPLAKLARTLSRGLSTQRTSPCSGRCSQHSRRCCVMQPRPAFRGALRPALLRLLRSTHFSWNNEKSQRAQMRRSGNGERMRIVSCGRAALDCNRTAAYIH